MRLERVMRPRRTAGPGLARVLVHWGETWSHPRGTLGRCHKGSEINIQRIKNRLPGIPGKPPLVGKVFFAYFWGAARAALAVAKLWSAAEALLVITCERARPSTRQHARD